MLQFKSKNNIKQIFWQGTYLKFIYRESDQNNFSSMISLLNVNISYCNFILMMRCLFIIQFHNRHNILHIFITLYSILFIILSFFMYPLEHNNIRAPSTQTIYKRQIAFTTQLSWLHRSVKIHLTRFIF